MLANQVAIITGASRGIGLATAQALILEGARVFAISRSALPGKAITNGIIPITTDLREPAQIEQAVQTILEQAGTIDILVNNAGVETFKPFLETTVEEYDQIIDTNLLGALLFTRAVLPTLLSKRSGHLVFINSVSGLRGFALDSVYCASKHALTGLAEALDEELRPQGVRVCSIHPGATDTRLSVDSWATAEDARRPYFLKPDDVAQVVVFALKQPPHMVISQVVLRPLIEPAYSDFLSVGLASDLIQAAQAQSGG